MRTRFIYLILLALKAISHLFYKHDTAWVSDSGDGGDPWKEFRLVLVLNHTSLIEWLFAGSVPNSFIWRIANDSIVPVADKTLHRPLVGRFFRLIIPNPIPITREADHTWRQVLENVGSEKMVLIFPEGRMKRADGLDKSGRPMTVRGGIADILRQHRGGPMLIAYGGGMHHIQVPGQHLPRLFKTIRIRFEGLDIDEYRRSIGSDLKPAEFKRAVRRDLDRRRDLYCPPLEEAAGVRYPLSPKASDKS
jgi:1-acyl-sn-glycerol-3-phosphate acyltransferase